MATRTTRRTKIKETKASSEPLAQHQAHGALAPDTSIMDLFKVSDGFGAKTLEDYQKKLKGMTSIEIQDHAHKVGVVPREPRTKLTEALERQFTTARAQRTAPKIIHLKTRPDTAEIMRRWQAGDIRAAQALNRELYPVEDK